MDVRKLIEEINALTEDELVDDFDDIEVSDFELTDEPKVEENTTESLDAKTKISRALDVLADAIEDFKNATVSEIDLVTDADLNVSFESLDGVVSEIRSALNGNTQPVVEEPVMDVEPVDELKDEDSGEEDFEEVDFDDEASLDLFGTEEDSEEE